MRKLILIAHISLDGFVAGPKGEFDDFPNDEENLVFVSKLTDEADAALFGRVSYQKMNSYWPTARDIPSASPGALKYSNWYNKAQKIVVSKTLATEGLMSNTLVIRDNIKEEIPAIKKKGGKDILIFGSPTVSRILMQMDLIDEYWIFINSVVFGQGIPLFTGGERKTKLKVEHIKQFANGEIAIKYSVLR
jgi:dihydrofolate reductase